jgi:integrase
VRDFKRPDAFRLWKQIRGANPALTKRTILHIRFFVSGVFEFAKNTGYYSGENPATADIPQDLPVGKETEAYTVEEVAQILSLLTSSKFQAIIALLWGSGLRKGEAEGLDWRDYERTDTGAKIHVRRSVWKGKISTPKNASSADVVHISNEIVEYIEAYRNFLGGVDEGFMFGTYDKPINLESFVRYELKPLMWAAGMTYKGLHGFRRGNATFLAKRVDGNGLKAASLVLRHSNEAVTRDHYVKNTKQERRAMVARRVVEISETRKQAAVVLGAGLRQTAIQ